MSSRKGLTLIELIVVLTILIALAGLLVPMLPSMLTRGHTATMTTNTGETAKAIMTFQQLYSLYPNNWDALGDGKTMINYFANGAACPPQYIDAPSIAAANGNAELQPLTLTQAEANALTGVGITQLQAMVTTPTGTVASGAFDPTFNYYSGATPTAGAIVVTQGTVLAGLDPTAQGPGSTTYQRCILDNFPVTGRYVALGIGPRNSMIGKTVQSAPVFFGDQPVINPEYAYGRFVAIFKVSDSALGASFTQAQLVGTAPVHDTGLDNIDSHLQNWYQLTTGGS
jgi:prepilin-type N-terminal cleavage/methylation domain-containing protein